MRLIDRFTRDEVSAKVWWPLALLGLIALILSVPLANRAADRTRADEAAHAAEVSVATIQPLTSTGAPASQVSQTARAIVAADPALSAVRVWDASHRLVASSDPTDQIGSGEAMNDAQIAQAETARATWVVAQRSLSGDASDPTYSAYTAIDGANATVVTQFEALDATLLGDVHHDWMWFRIVVGLGTALVFALALLSMREPAAKIGAGVPFVPENVPPWLRVMDVDRAVALEHAGERAHDRVAGLQARLDESERQRLKAEGELQQTLTALGTKARPTAPLVVPDMRPADSYRATPPAEPFRAMPSPEAAAAAVAAAEQKKRARAAAAAEKQRAKAEAVAAEATKAASEASQQPPRPDRLTVGTDDVAVTADVQRREAPGEGPHVVVVPDPTPAEVAVAAGSGRADPEARDVLERLVPEPVDRVPADDVDELRSRLARTAALKKPGSRERTDRPDGDRAS
jgi:hypothetical protein